jgi:hypothetical protein
MEDKQKPELSLLKVAPDNLAQLSKNIDALVRRVSGREPTPEDARPGILVL